MREAPTAVADRHWLQPFVAAGILWLIVTLPRALAPHVHQIVVMVIVAVFIALLVGLLMLGLALWNAQFKYAAALLCALAALVIGDNFKCVLRTNCGGSSSAGTTRRGFLWSRPATA